MGDLFLDSARSLVRINTFAEGVLARLAHDLDLECRSLEGTATTATDGATTGSARVNAPLSGMSVRGTLGKDGRLDQRALSAGDRQNIVSKMRQQVFQAGAEAVVRVEAHLRGGSARVRVVPPNGKAVETVMRPTVRIDGESLHATGTFELSLSAIGSDAIKGPMGAFRMKDRVRISFEIVFAPPGQPA